MNSSKSSMTNAHQIFLREFCDSCLKPASNICGKAFTNITIPIECPLELVETHRICPFCAGIVPRDIQHDLQCAFALAGYHLRAAGWSTPASQYVLRTLRYARTPYYQPLLNWLQVLLTPLIVEDTVVVPVPIGLPQRSIWVELLQSSVATLPSTTILPAIRRDRQRSTRSGSSASRISIAAAEYSLETTMLEQLTQRHVILIDDNVTTGNTLLHCAALIQECHPISVSPVALEKNVSPRIAQRCLPSAPLSCPIYMPNTSRT